MTKEKYFGINIPPTLVFSTHEQKNASKICIMNKYSLNFATSKLWHEKKT